VGNVYDFMRMLLCRVLIKDLLVLFAFSRRCCKGVKMLMYPKHATELPHGNGCQHANFDKFDS
jgi:hypothetical protein